LVIIPAAYHRLTLVQMTVLSSANQPIIVIQDRGKVILIGGDGEKTVKYTVIPFLMQQGINQVDFAMSFNPSADRSFLADSILLKKRIHLPEKQSLNLADLQINFLNSALLQLQFKGQTWLWLISDRMTPKILQDNIKYYPDVLLWSSKSLHKNWLNWIQPQKVAISTVSEPNSTTKNLLSRKQIKLYWIGKDGAIQWSPRKGFQTHRDEINF
jgi:competence protein ComEC